MLRILQSNTNVPYSFTVDPSATFMPGMIGQLTVSGNQVSLGVSDGTAPLGVIDDIRTNSFTATVWNETFVIPIANPIVGPNGNLVTSNDVTYALEQSNIVANSFISLNQDCQLLAKNGMVTFIAGTPLNYTLSGGTYDSIKAVVNYTYFIPNMPGDDSVSNSGKISVWYDRMMFETDQFETNQLYPVNANLYVNSTGKLTSVKQGNNPAVGIVIGPPSPLTPFLQVFWF